MPFELGRPLGEPGDPAFQRRVLKAALQLLAEARQPGVIMDYDQQAPGYADDPGWLPPFAAATPGTPAGGATLRDALKEELQALTPAYRQAVARHGRTTVGNSGLPLNQVVGFLCAMANGELPDSPIPGQRLAMAMRLAADDLKAHHLEAAAASGRPSSRQLQGWFWDATVAGQALIRLRSSVMASDDRLLRMLGSGQLVPAEHRVRLGL